jgi:hypothetical protein
VRALKEAAIELRRLHHERSRRGRTTTPAERKEAKRLETILRLFRIDIPADRLGDLKLALGKLGHGA